MYKTWNEKALCVVYYACSRVSDIKNYAGNLSQSIQPYLYTCKCLSHNTTVIKSHQLGTQWSYTLEIPIINTGM